MARHLAMLLLLSYVPFVSSVNFGPHIIHLTATNWVGQIEERHLTVWFVMFHRRDCKKCENAYPEVIRAAKEAVGVIKFGEVDVDEFDFASRFDISHLPNFLVFYPDGHEEWEGYPSWRSMVNAAMQRIPDLSAPVQESWASDPGFKSVILFSNKDKPPPLWAAISCNFSDSDITIGWTNSSAVFESFAVKRVPAIVMIDRLKKFTYNGKVEFGPLRRTIVGFFQGRITPTPTPTTTPVRVLARNLTNADVFATECKDRAVYCVLVGGDTIDERLEALAHAYERFRIRFFACGEKCPVPYAREGVWVLDHTGDGAIHLANLDGIETTLNDIGSGRAEFGALPQKSDL
jgi:thiol-disulfide isomerase/thioredoxin